MQQLVGGAIEHFGQLDVVVNNAGARRDRERQLDLRVKGFPLNAPYVASKHAIISLTRVAALEPAARGIRVSAVAPSPVQTAMLDRVTGGGEEAEAAFLSTIPVGGAGDQREIADAIGFIASSQASFLTGQTMFLDGGVTAP